MIKEDFTQAHAIFKKRKESIVRFKFFVITGGVFLFGVFLIGFSYILIYSNFFKVKNIAISGNTFMPREELISALIQLNFNKGFKWLSWLGPDNILFWKAAEGIDNKLDKLVKVASVTVSTDLWRKEVKLQVIERKLFGIWCVIQDCYGFDENGVIFIKTPSIEGALYLRIDDLNNRPLLLGQPVLPNARWFQNLITSLKILKNQSLIPVKIIVDNLELREWQIKMASGTYFYFSLEFVPDNLSGILKSLSSKVDFNQLTAVDFRVPNRIYYK